MSQPVFCAFSLRTISIRTDILRTGFDTIKIANKQFSTTLRQTLDDVGKNLKITNLPDWYNVSQKVI